MYQAPDYEIERNELSYKGLSQIDSPKEKERNEISPAALASWRGWAEGKCVEEAGEERLGRWERKGNHRGLGTGSGALVKVWVELTLGEPEYSCYGGGP